MKFKVRSELINKKVNEASKIAIRNNFNPLFECIFFKTEDHYLIIKATNMELFYETIIPIKTDINGEFYIKATNINKILESFSYNNEFLELEKNNNVLIIKNEKNNQLVLELFNNEENTFLNLPKQSKIGIEIDKSVFVDSVRSVAFCASKTEIKPEISGVYIYNKENNLYFVATDTYRLAEKVVYFDTIGEINVILQNKNINTILSLFEGDGVINIDYYEEGIIVTDKENIISIRSVNGNYPDYRQLFPKEWNRVIKIKKDAFGKVLQTTIMLSENDKVVNFEFDKNFLKIKADQKSMGSLTEFIEIINVNSEQNMTDFNIYYNPVFVQEGLTKIKDQEVIMYFTEERRPMFITSDKDKTFIYLVMPRFK